MRPLLLPLFVLAAAAATPLASQVPAYRLGAADSLTYREISREVFQLRVPRDDMDLPGVLLRLENMDARTFHDAVITVRGSIPGTVQAWYQQLTRRQEGPGSETSEPATASMLRAPFDLRVAVSGRVESVRAPSMPDDAVGLEDLPYQFDDFFITVPSAPLTPGTRWNDTTLSTHGTRPRHVHRARRIRSYEVVGDTTLRGVTARLIRVHTTITSEGRSSEGELSYSAVLTGADSGWAAFSLEEGRMVARAKQGSLRGTLTISGGPRPVVAAQSFTYRTAVELQ